MKLLFTGKGTSGSWAIRGAQISAALGAKAIPLASLAQCLEADVIVGVKRIPDALLSNIRKSGRPFIWDCVDAYPQPQCSAWGELESLAWAKDQLSRLKPNAVIWPNERMRLDVGAGRTIYHHHRPGIQRNPIRERITRIGYEGSASYIDGWMPAIKRQCERIGAEFVLNPVHLADVDVVLALRDKNHAGYPQRFWKSNIKLANAHGSGTPFIGMPEPGYEETATGAEHWATNGDELGTALDWLESQATRQQISGRFLKAALPIDKVAQQYRDFLCALKS